jgi:hypothetical protein
MKKMMLLLLLASGCAPHNHKAQDAISAHLRKLSRDPSSYLAISFGEPRVNPAKATTVLINHVYQQKNAADSLVIASGLFVVDSVSGSVQMLAPAPGTN